MNLPNSKFSNKNYNLNNTISNQTKQSNQIKKPLFKSFNGNYYESFEEARNQNMKIYNSFSNKSKR